MATELTPEQLGMLNGRQAALHAAIADLLANGVLVQDGQRLRTGRQQPRGIYITALQSDIRRAIHNGRVPAEDESVKTQLGTLQAQMAGQGYLKPSGTRGDGRRSRTDAIPAAVIAFACLALAGWTSSVSSSMSPTVPWIWWQFDGPSPARHTGHCATAKFPGGRLVRVSQKVHTLCRPQQR